MSEKVYYNENLEKILNHYIKEEKYGGFKPLLNEIFQRRAYEFGFDDRHMKKEIRNFERRIEKIKFGINIPKANEFHLACYYSGLRKGDIFFNCESNILKNNNIDWIELYEALTHEVYHAISHHIKSLGKYIRINEMGFRKRNCDK